MFSFKTKIFLGMMAVVSTYSILSLVAIGNYTDRLGADEVGKSLQKGKDAYTYFLGLRQHLLINQGRSLAQAPHLRAVLNITGVDHGTVFYTAREMHELTDLDLMLLVDTEGHLLADVADIDASGFDMAGFPGVGNGLDIEEFSGVWYYQNALFNIALTPVVVADQIVGLLVVGDRLDGATADDIRRFTGMEALILDRGQVVAQSVDSLVTVEELALAVDGYSAASPDLVQPIRLELGGQTYFALVIPLENTQGRVVLCRSLMALEAQIEKLRLSILGISAICIVGVVGLSLLLARRASQPLAQLKETAEEISAGRLDKRVEIRHRDEVGQLGQSFNHMVDQLVVANRAIEASNQVLEARVEERTASLAEVNSQLRHLLTASPAVIYSRGLAAQNPLEFVSGNVEKLLGHPPAAFVDDPSFWADHLHIEDLPVVIGEMGQVTQRGHWIGEYRFENVEGESRWVRDEMHLARDEEGKPLEIVGSLIDITDRKRAEEAIQQRDARYRALIENASDLVLIVGPEGLINYASPSIKRMLGYDDYQCQGLNYFDWVDVQDRSRVGQHQQAVCAGAVDCQSIDFQIVHSDNSLRIVQAVYRNMLWEDAVAGIVLSIQDITQRKQAEVQLAEAHKMESIGQLAAGVAHEINTPMQFIGDCTHFLRDAFESLNGVLGKYHQLLEATQNQSVSPQLVDELHETLEEADMDFIQSRLPKAFEDTSEGIGRVREIVNAMRDFSHPGSGQKEPTDLNQTIRKATILARNEWKYIAELELVLDPTMVLVPCMPGDISRAIVNLVVNAAHAIANKAQGATSEKGKITISTSQDDLWAEVRVVDTGSGIPAAVQPHVFVPFFTTKEVGKGTGQGLAIVQNTIVAQHGGQLFFETEEDCGTTFIIRLPLSLTGVAQPEKVI